MKIEINTENCSLADALRVIRAAYGETPVPAADREDAEHNSVIESEPEQTRWVFTFGFDHKHPVTGASLASQYITIPGNAELSRARMNAAFGSNWAMQYPINAGAGRAVLDRGTPIDPAPIWGKGATYVWNVS